VSVTGREKVKKFKSVFQKTVENFQEWRNPRVDVVKTIFRRKRGTVKGEDFVSGVFEKWRTFMGVAVCTVGVPILSLLER